MRSSILALVPLFAAFTAVACAPAKPAETSLTSAEVAPPAAKNEMPSTREPTSPGQLVCKTSNKEDGTVELFLEWNGPSARGLLRQTAPSGMLYQTTVRAEHYRNAIIADDVLSDDLVVHAAVVRTNGGKQQIRLGEWHQPWANCE